MNEPAPPTNSIYLGSTRAQHQQLVDQSAVVLKLGLLLMKSGASAYRVKVSMARLAKAVGLDEHHAQVHFTEVSTTAYTQGNFRTEIAETRIKGISAYKIDLLSDFVSSLPERIDPAQASAALTQIEKAKPLYAPWLLALAAACACAAFAFLNRGGVIECSVVLLAAFAGQFLRSTLAHRGLNHMVVWMLCGFLSAGIYVGVINSLVAAELVADNHLVGFISSVLYLVPGFPLVTGMLEISRMDFGSGIARLAYVAVLLASASFAVWLTSFVFSLPLEQAPVPQIASGLLLGLWVLSSFTAAFGFAMLFSATPASCMWAGAIAAVVNPGRLLLVEHGWAPHLAIALAALSAGVGAELVAMALKHRISRVSLAVPATVTMIPGVMFYMSMAHFSNGNVAEALAIFVQVLLIFAALGMGLALSRLLMDKDWLYDRDTQVLSSLSQGRLR
ncbi:MAG: threonine/serine exporter family protein [Rothia sp. (in: high G+C Gram-positive bacteria)]|nr:threonine/serine exporter family protein [Rothia sp. (in: high G+C Gram-positive bacteria)]